MTGRSYDRGLGHECQAQRRNSRVRPDRTPLRCRPRPPKRRGWRSPRRPRPGKQPASERYGAGAADARHHSGPRPRPRPALRPRTPDRASSEHPQPTRPAAPPGARPRQHPALRPHAPARPDRASAEHRSRPDPQHHSGQTGRGGRVSGLDSELGCRHEKSQRAGRTVAESEGGTGRHVLGLSATGGSGGGLLRLVRSGAGPTVPHLRPGEPARVPVLRPLRHVARRGPGDGPPADRESGG